MKKSLSGGKIMICLLWLAVAMLPLSGAGAAKAEKGVPACLFQVRDGMPNLAAKLKAGKKVEIVFLGGSITVMGGYTQDGYVRYVERWLKERYPRAEIKIRNAGVPGTGSEYGAKRYDRDVLRHQPDAVFIEFAVNDGKSDQTASMERMVHKSWRKDPRIDLVFFYTLDKSHLESYRNGVLPFAAGCHERVAERYGIPTIGLAYHVAEKINSGKIHWKKFSGDTCHPSAQGFRLFDEAFAAALPELLRTKNDGGLQHKLGVSITPNLEVYPPALKAKPLVSPKTFLFADGEAPADVYELPLPAEHWVGKPVYYSSEGKVLWRIECLPRRFAGKLDGKSGSDRSLWNGKAAEWFEEGRCFILRRRQIFVPIVYGEGLPVRPAEIVLHVCFDGDSRPDHLIEILCIKDAALSDRFLLGNAADLPSFFPCLVQRRQQKRNQDGNDSNDDQKFNKGKHLFCLH